MKSKVGMSSGLRSGVALLLLPALMLPASGDLDYRRALPGYTYSFPRDHFAHPDFRTEWWYYTGNLKAANGRRFGFEVTFFRHGLEVKRRTAAGVWDVDDVWLAHFAMSDLDGKRFFHTERLSRSGPGLAGGGFDKAAVWNGNWSVRWTLDAAQRSGFREKSLKAATDRFAVDLTLTSPKPPVVHGRNGVSQKSAGAGRASHYISLTRMPTRGSLTYEGETFTVEGQSWMDHEFFTHSLESNQAGWDWFSLQLDDGSELMLYRLRRKDGSVEPLSSGTYVSMEGTARHLSLADYRLVPGRTWKSAKTGGTYPIEWKIEVPSLNIELGLMTRLDNQELVGKAGVSPVYWEGAVEVVGSRGGKPLRGTGYLELTGYAGAVSVGE